MTIKIEEAVILTWITLLIFGLIPKQITSNNQLLIEQVKNPIIGQVLGDSTKAEDPSHPIELYWAKGGEKSNALRRMGDLGVKIYSEDKIESFPKPEMGLGGMIKVERALPVRIIDGNNEKLVRTWKTDIRSLFQENNVLIGEKDIVQPGVNTPLTNIKDIKITRVAETLLKIRNEIGYSTILKKDSNLDEGKTRIAQEGKNGVRLKVYHIRRENGRQISKKLIKNQIIKAPKAKIIVKGTRPLFPELTVGQYHDLINSAARKFRMNPIILYRLMMIESNGNCYSHNPNGYYGLYQYSKSAWLKLSSEAGYGGASIYDARAQIYVTAWAITHGYGVKWPTLGRARQ